MFPSADLQRSREAWIWPWAPGTTSDVWLRDVMGNGCKSEKLHRQGKDLREGEYPKGKEWGTARGTRW